MTQWHFCYRDREKEPSAPESPPVRWDMEAGTFTVMSLDRAQEPLLSSTAMTLLGHEEQGLKIFLFDAGLCVSLPHYSVPS